MRFVKIEQYSQRPSFRDAVAAMRRERQGYDVSLMSAFEQAERELAQPQQNPQVRVATQSLAENLKPLIGLADDTTSVDDEEEAVVEDEQGVEEGILDEDERTELAVEAALEEEGTSNPEAGIDE
jgi:hypothetical protein